MAYNINKSDGTLLVTVADGGINAAATTIKLIGRDLSNYGEILNENLVHMLEHFASTSEPTNPLEGQIWYDTSVSLLKFWNGSAWIDVSTGAGSIAGGTNLGAGDGVFAQVSGTSMEFKSLVGGNGVSLSASSTEIEISNDMGPISAIAPGVGQVLKWNGTQWVPGDDEVGSGSGGGGSGNVIEAGAIFASAGTMSAPFFLCDGSAVSRTLYPDLFAAIGETYGAGDGSTTFNLPDLTGRFAVGAGDSGTTGSTLLSLGDDGGEAEHTLIIDEIPAHDHTGGVQSYMGDQLQTTGLAPGGVEVPTGSTGGGNSHNNMPPYLTINWYIASEAVGGGSGGGGGTDVSLDGLTFIPVDRQESIYNSLTSAEWISGHTVDITAGGAITVPDGATHVKIRFGWGIVPTGTQNNWIFSDATSGTINTSTGQFSRIAEVEGVQYTSWVQPFDTVGDTIYMAATTDGVHSYTIYNTSVWVDGFYIEDQAVIDAGSSVVGEIKMFAGAIPPSGWLICDGSSLDTSTYSALFSVLDYTYGGSGSNFNIPDAQGRTAVGAGGGVGLSARALGDEGGEEDVTLTEAQLASHTHTGGTTDSAGNHTHSYEDRYIKSGGGNGLGNFTNGSVSDTTRTTDSNGSHTHNISSIGNAGSDEAHNNMQPFFVVNYIIYAGV